MKKNIFITSLLALATLASQAQANQTCNDNIRTDTPDRQFTVNGNTVTDNKTGLMWARCSLGQYGNDCAGSAQTYTWSEALQAAEDSQIAGYNDWRLPNVKELKSIVNEKCINPAINANIFPNTKPADYRTSSPSPYTEDKHDAFTVHFYNGNNYSHPGINTYKYHVRLVRGGQVSTRAVEPTEIENKVETIEY